MIHRELNASALVVIRIAASPSYMQANATVTVSKPSASPIPSKAAAADLADKEQTILELRETNEVLVSSTVVCSS